MKNFYKVRTAREDRWIHFDGGWGPGATEALCFVSPLWLDMEAVTVWTAQNTTKNRVHHFLKSLSSGEESLFISSCFRFDDPIMLLTTLRQACHEATRPSLWQLCWSTVLNVGKRDECQLKFCLSQLKKNSCCVFGLIIIVVVVVVLGKSLGKQTLESVLLQFFFLPDSALESFVVHDKDQSVDRTLISPHFGQ